MRGAITIAARDLRERSFVFITAAIVATIPFLAAALRLGNSSPAWIIAVTGMILCVTVSLGVAGVLGASMIGRDLSERRLSFYFSKPVSPLAIWFGKLAGAIATVALCFGVIFLPSFLAANTEWQKDMPAPGFIAVVLAASVYLLLVMHAFGTMIRSRSGLVAVDLIVLALLAGAMWLTLRPLLSNMAMVLVMWIWQSVVLAIPVIIIAAGAWQLSRGRTDIRRSHRELSAFLWTAVAAVTGITAMYVAWVVSATPRDVVNPWASAATSGDWMVMSGPARHRGDYQPSFLVDTRDGHYVRFASSRWQPPQFALNGNAAISIAPTAESLRKANGEVHVWSLPKMTDVATGVETSIYARVVLSDDLSRLAIFTNHILSVYDIGSRSLLASVRIPAGEDAMMFFVSPSRVRVYALAVMKLGSRIPDGQLPIYEFDVASRRLNETGKIRAVRWTQIAASPDGSTLAIAEFPNLAAGQLLIVDGRSGATRATINSASHSRWVDMLEGGGLSFAESTRIRIFDAQGNPVREIPLGPLMERGVMATRIREIVPGRKLLVLVRHNLDQKNPALDSDIGIVDVERGVVERIEHAVSLRDQVRTDDPRMPRATTTFVIADPTGTLWRWNALTGEKRKILSSS
jgi:hypothetical protein